jgi:hypothetical protein
MDPSLHVRVFPHFMNFERRKKEYHSKKVCGQLFDLVQTVDFTPRIDAAFDKRILGKFKIPKTTAEAAAEIKMAYDASIRRIMKQYLITTELEVWSTFVMNAVKIGTDFKFSEVIGNLSAALKETYRAECYQAAGSREDKDIVPFVAAMYEVTWNELERFNESQSVQEDPQPEEKPLVSFPWLFHSILGKIANAQSIEVITREPRRAAYAEVVAAEVNRSKKGECVVDENHGPIPEKQNAETTTPTKGVNGYPITEKTDEPGRMEGRESPGPSVDVSSKASETTGDSYEQSIDEELEVEVSLQDAGGMSLLEQLGNL